MELSNEDLQECFQNYHRALYDDFYRDPDQMVLTVKSSNGKNLKILVDSSFTIYYVKLNIEYAYGRHIYPLEQQEVRHRGVVLEDEVMLLGTAIFDDGYVVLDMKSEESGSKKFREGTEKIIETPDDSGDFTDSIKKNNIKAFLDSYKINQGAWNDIGVVGAAVAGCRPITGHSITFDSRIWFYTMTEHFGSADVLGLLAVNPVQQQLILDAGALPHLVDLLKKPKNGLWTSIPARGSPLPSEEAKGSDVATTALNVRKDLTEWQELHEAMVLTIVKEISRLRYELWPRIMKEEVSPFDAFILVIYIPLNFSLLVVGVLGSGSFLLQWFPWCRRVDGCVVDARKLFKKILQRGVGSWRAIVLMYIQGTAPKLFADRPLKGVFAPFDRGRKRILVDCILGVLFFEESVLRYLWALTAQAVCSCNYRDVIKFISGYMASLSAMTQLELFYISFQILLACELSQMNAYLSSNLVLLVESVENCKGKAFHDEIGSPYYIALENLKSLQELDVTYNIISNFSEIDFLVCLPFLRSLWLEGNPLCCAQCYRAQVFSYFIHLDKGKLDNKHISNREYWKWQIIIDSRQKRPATFGFYSPAKHVAKEEGGNIKPRGESVKLKKEDSLSSMESDSRSSNFVFMQGAFNATSYEKQTGRSMVYQHCFTFDPPEGVLFIGKLMKQSERYINEEISLFSVACISLDENKIFVFDPGG